MRVPIIEMTGISKSFPGVIANEDITFKVYGGEIHALLGENGAGKSTLMSILAGLYQPDAGIIKVKGQTVKLRSPRHALGVGVGMIYQHLRLVDNFTVAENIALGVSGQGFFLNRVEIEAASQNLSDQFGMDINPRAKVNQLSLGEQQRVEILKMLYRGCDILILDEPTTVLTPRETRDLFKVLRLMAQQGKAIILITHKLNEVKAIADSITVLRRGRVVGSASNQDLTEQDLTRMMVDREIIPVKTDRHRKVREAVLEIKNLDVTGDQGHRAVQNASLTIERGEIMVIAGVAGNGQRELIEAIGGLRPIEAGQITLAAEDISALDVRARLRRGINMVPENRLGMGLVPNLSIMENGILRNYHNKDFYRGIFFDYKKIRDYVNKLVEKYNVQLADINHPVNYLSGGNLQKLLLAREISQAPQVLLASYPVRGLDIASAEAVFTILQEEREKGTAILLVLEDLEDVFRLADRIAVMFNGQINAVLDVEDTDVEEIGFLMLGMAGEKVNGAENQVN